MSPGEDIQGGKKSIRPSFWLLCSAISIALVSPRPAAILFLLFVALSIFEIPWRRAWAPSRTRWMGMFAAMAIAWILLRSNIPWLSASGQVAATGYPIDLGNLIPYLLLFLILHLRGFRPSEYAALQWALVITVPICFIICVAQVKFDWRGQLSLGPDSFPLVELRVNRPVLHRFGGPFHNWNALGCYLVFTGLAATSLLVRAYRDRKQSVSSRFHYTRTSLLWITLGFTLLMMTACGSMSTLLVMTLVLIVLSIGMRLRLHAVVVPLLLWWTLVLAAVSGPAPVATWARIAVPDVLWSRLSSTESWRKQSVSTNSASRMKIFRCAIEITAERPWAGWGIGNFAPECEDRMRTRPRGVNHAHNAFLQLASELGLPFAILASILVIALLSRATVGALGGSRPEALEVGFLLTAVAMVLLLQVNLALAHIHRLEVLFWINMAIISSTKIAERAEEPLPGPRLRCEAQG